MTAGIIITSRTCMCAMSTNVAVLKRSSRRPFCVQRGSYGARNVARAVHRFLLMEFRSSAVAFAY